MSQSLSRVLVAIDGSEGALNAAIFAGELIGGREISATLMHVREETNLRSTSHIAQNATGSELAGLARGLYKQNHQQGLGELSFDAATRALGISNVETIVLTGNPAREICEYAKTNDIDLIVIGSRGLSDLAELFLGSVSSDVLHRAHCAVTVVR